MFGRAFRLGQAFGIEIQVDVSLAIIFVLVAVSLGAGAFPQWHPGWGAVQIWIVAVVAAVLFFASVLAHEMSHALVGRVQGIPVRRITLFVFGGMAHMEGEPPSPKAEFLMAVVGPVTSIVIGLAATFAGMTMAGPAFAAAETSEEVMAAFRDVGPASTLLLWLGPINILLGVFNLVPGFPLDGGRVARAALWWLTGDIRKATMFASGVGQTLGLLLIAAGIAMAFGVHVPLFGRGPVGGLWLVLIGWFLKNAAQMSYRQLLLQQSLQGVTAERVMRTDMVTVVPTMTVEQLVEEHAIRSEQTVFPVVGEGGVAGQVFLDSVRKLDRDAWTTTSVRDIMTPLDEGSVLAPETGAMQALQRLSQSGKQQLLVVRDGELVGVVRQADLVRWVTLHGASHASSRGTPGAPTESRSTTSRPPIRSGS